MKRNLGLRVCGLNCPPPSPMGSAPVAREPSTIAQAPEFSVCSPSKGVARGGRGGPAPPPPKSGGSQKYIRGDPCDLGSEAKNRGSGPPKWVPPPPKWVPPRNQILATPLSPSIGLCQALERGARSKEYSFLGYRAFSGDSMKSGTQSRLTVTDWGNPQMRERESLAPPPPLDNSIQPSERQSLLPHSHRHPISRTGESNTRR